AQGLRPVQALRRGGAHGQRRFGRCGLGRAGGLPFVRDRGVQSSVRAAGHGDQPSDYKQHDCEGWPRLLFWEYVSS
ncbi:MAG: hypothetical protein MZW92_58125, partial [Comamonadaceae bacterium]|nr:hypothetical protein [Comamonadaceae bacterium]